MEKSLQHQNVDSLRAQLNATRIPLSKAANDIVQFCLQNEGSDPLVTPGARKPNPWAEKSKCMLI
ncbi:guanine nucleotide-binding protein subunit gamma-e isoform X1 [Hydra vulgaris]|uniref:guanine nucleotide-binding protein subunit gamma-e isoform X1 n=1 Tax=Hydra vulgaris TaxID=6087 RepID=UPI0002B49217|nr:guanine nucleotide-binding protein subunit gamma-e [Hydra vulgaris]